MNIVISGTIGDFSEDPNNILTASALTKALEGVSKDEKIIVNINSPGGSVFEGFGMYNALKAISNEVETQINGMAFSIASLIALAGDKIQMSEVSMFMIHQASGMAKGTAEEMAKQHAVLKSIDETLVSVYSERSSIERGEVVALMQKETFYTSAEAKKAGFVDEIINKLDKSQASQFNINEQMSNIRKFWNQVMTGEGVNPSAVEETEEEKKKKEDEKALAADPQNAEDETDEEKKKREEEEEAKKDEEMNAKFVNRDDFDKLLAAMNAMPDLIEKVVTEHSENAAQKAVDNLKAGLRKSNAQPIATNNSNTVNPSGGYIDRYANFRNSMQEIDKNTRK